MNIAPVFPSKSIDEVSIQMLKSLRNEILNSNSAEFEPIAVSCFNHLLKIIQSIDSSSLTYLSSKILVDLLASTSNHPSLFREFSTLHVHTLISFLIRFIETRYSPSYFIILEAILQYYPGCVSYQAGKIEKLILKAVDENPSESIHLKILAQCFAYLPFIGQLSKREIRWAEFYNKLCGTFIYCINYFYDSLGMSCDLAVNDKRINFPNVSNSEQEALQQIVKRFRFSLYCLSSILLNGSSCPLKYDLSKILRSYDALLSINSTKFVRSSLSPENESVYSNIVLLQIEFNSVVQIMYETLLHDSFVCNHQVMNVVIRQLNWTKPSVQKPYQDSFSKFRRELYKTVHFVILNSNELCYDVIYLNRNCLLDHLLYDVNVIYNSDSQDCENYLSEKSIKTGLISKKSRKSSYFNSKKKLAQNSKLAIDLDASYPSLTVAKINLLAHADTTIMAWRVLAAFVNIIFNNTSINKNSIDSISNLWHQISWQLESTLSLLTSASLEPVPVAFEFLKFIEHYCLIQQRSICPVSFSSIRNFLLSALNHCDMEIRLYANTILTRLDAVIGSWTPRLCRSEFSLTSHCLHSSLHIDESPTPVDVIQTGTEDSSFDVEEAQDEPPVLDFEPVVEKTLTDNVSDSQESVSKEKINKRSASSPVIHTKPSREAKISKLDPKSNSSDISDSPNVYSRQSSELSREAKISKFDPKSNSSDISDSSNVYSHQLSDFNKAGSLSSPNQEIVEINNSYNNSQCLSISEMLETFVDTLE